MIKTQLVLKSADINESIKGYQPVAGSPPIANADNYTSPDGSFINEARNRMIFSNINLRSILGPIYEPDSYYNMQLKNIVFHLSENLSVFAGFEHRRNFNIYLSFEPNILLKAWSNGSVKSEILIASVRVPSGGVCQYFNYYNDNEITFYLPNGLYNADNIKIEIQIRDQVTDQILPRSSFSVPIPNSQYTFSIYKVCK